MSFKKRGFFIVLSVLILFTFLSQNVDAALPFMDAAINLYEDYYGWLDFVVYLFLFAAIFRHALPRIFSKGDGEDLPRVMIPLILILSIVFSASTTAFAIQNNFSLMDIGSAIVIFLLIALALLIWGRFKPTSENKKREKKLKKLSGKGMIILILLLLFIIPNFFPRLTYWLPGGMGDTYFIWGIGIVIAFVLLRFLWSLLFGKDTEEKGPGGGGGGGKPKPPKDNGEKERKRLEKEREKERRREKEKKRKEEIDKGKERERKRKDEEERRKLAIPEASLIIRSTNNTSNKFIQGKDNKMQALALIQNRGKCGYCTIDWQILKKGFFGNKKINIPFNNSRNGEMIVFDLNSFKLKKNIEERGIRAIIRNQEGKYILIEQFFSVVKTRNTETLQDPPKKSSDEPPKDPPQVETPPETEPPKDKPNETPPEPKIPKTKRFKIGKPTEEEAKTISERQNIKVGMDEAVELEEGNE